MNLQVSVREKPAIHTRNHFNFYKQNSIKLHISTNIALIFMALPKDSPRTLEYMDVPHKLFKCNFSAGTISVNVKYSPVPGAWQRFLAMLLHTGAEHFGNVIFRYSELPSQYHIDASIDVYHM